MSRKVKLVYIIAQILRTHSVLLLLILPCWLISMADGWPSWEVRTLGAYFFAAFWVGVTPFGKWIVFRWLLEPEEHDSFKSPWDSRVDGGGGLGPL